MISHFPEVDWLLHLLHLPGPSSSELPGLSQPQQLPAAPCSSTAAVPATAAAEVPATAPAVPAPAAAGGSSPSCLHCKTSESLQQSLHWPASPPFLQAGSETGSQSAGCQTQPQLMCGGWRGGWECLGLTEGSVTGAGWRPCGNWRRHWPAHYTAHYTLHTAHYTAHSTLHTLHYTLCTAVPGALRRPGATGQRNNAQLILGQGIVHLSSLFELEMTASRLLSGQSHSPSLPSSGILLLFLTVRTH